MKSANKRSGCAIGNNSTLCIRRKFPYGSVTVGIVVFLLLSQGCMNGAYKIESSAEEPKTVMPYEVVDSLEAERTYSTDKMPIVVRDWTPGVKFDQTGIILWGMTFGLFPLIEEYSSTHEVEIETPLGSKKTRFTAYATTWSGWLPCIIPYPCFSEERAYHADKKGLSKFEQIGKDRAVNALVGQFTQQDYVTFAETKNKEREMEVARIKELSVRIDGLLSKHCFDDALSMIETESKPRKGTWKCDGKSWADMRERVAVVHRAYDKMHAQTLIATGKYEDAVSFCDSKNSLPDDVNSELKNNAVKAAVKELKDANRLIAFLKLIKDNGMRDDVVMKLKSLNSLAQLSNEQLCEIANTSESDDVVLSVIGVVNDKNVLISFFDDNGLLPSFFDKDRSINVIKALLKKIADADAVRAKIWDDGKEDQLLAYVSVFGSDDECLKLIKAYPNLLTDAVIKELKPKISKEETKSAIEELQTNRLAGELAKLKTSEAIDRIRAIPDGAVRSKMAQSVLNHLKDNLGLHNTDDKDGSLAAYGTLVSLMSKADVIEAAEKILDACKTRIHFEGFYVGMPLREYYIMKAYKGGAPSMPSEDITFIFSWTSYHTDLPSLTFSRGLRYKLFEKEDGEFWSAFMRKYIPAGKKKSLGEAIGDALDGGTYSYQEGYDDELRERCYIYKSMKYGTKVTFGQESGKLILEEYK